MKKVLAMVAGLAAVQVWGTVVTNTWVWRGTEGSWTDLENWEIQDAGLIGTNGTPVFVKIPPFVSGERTITVPAEVEEVALYGLQFGERTNTDADKQRTEGNCKLRLKGTRQSINGAGRGNIDGLEGSFTARFHAMDAGRDTQGSLVEVWNATMRLWMRWEFAAPEACGTVVWQGNGTTCFHNTLDASARTRLAWRGGMLQICGMYWGGGSYDQFTGVELVQETPAVGAHEYDVTKAAVPIGGVKGMEGYGLMLGWSRKFSVGGLPGEDGTYKTNILNSVQDEWGNHSGEDPSQVEVACNGVLNFREQNKMNGFAGVVRVNGGDLLMGEGSRLGTNAWYRVEAGTLELGTNQTAAALGGDAGALGEVRIKDGEALTLTGNAKPATAGGVTTVGESGAAVTGDGDLEIDGENFNQILTGKSTYGGATRIKRGTLTVRGEGGGDLVCWYRFDDARMPGRDSSGNGVDLSVEGHDTGDVAIVEDAERGKVLALNVGERAVTVGEGGEVKPNNAKYMTSYVPYPSGNPVGDGEHTVSVWHKMSENSKAGFSHLVTLDVSHESRGVFVAVSPSEIFAEGPVKVGHNIPIGEWMHIVKTYRKTADDRPVDDTYLNGELIHSVTGKVGVARSVKALNALAVGFFNWQYARGYMDDCKVFSRALSAEEVAAEYGAGMNGGDGATFGGEKSRAGVKEALEEVEEIPAGVQSFTVAGWVELPEGETGPGTLFSFGEEGALGYNANSELTLTMPGVTNLTVKSVFLRAGAARRRRHHVALVREADLKRCYFAVDGRLARRFAKDSNTYVPYAGFGGNGFEAPVRPAAGEHVSGMRVYAVALGAGELARLVRDEEFGEGASVLPRGTEVEVGEGGALRVEAGDVEAGKVVGEGRVHVLRDGALFTTADGEFGMRLSGGGHVGASEGEMTFACGEGELAGFTGRVTVKGKGRVKG